MSRRFCRGLWNLTRLVQRRNHMVERRTLVILFLMMIVTFGAFSVAEGLEQAEQAPAPAGVLAK